VIINREQIQVKTLPFPGNHPAFSAQIEHPEKKCGNRQHLNVPIRGAAKNNQNPFNSDFREGISDKHQHKPKNKCGAKTDDEMPKAG
jgi:hypothetical protein